MKNKHHEIHRVFHPRGDVRGAQDGAVPEECQEEQDRHRRARPFRTEGQPHQFTRHTHATALDRGKWFKIYRVVHQVVHCHLLTACCDGVQCSYPKAQLLI